MGIEPSPAAARAEEANRLETPTAAELARNSRRSSVDDVADMSDLPVGNATCDNQPMLDARDGGSIGADDDNPVPRSPLLVRVKNIIFRRHDRVAREPAIDGSAGIGRE